MSKVLEKVPTEHAVGEVPKWSQALLDSFGPGVREKFKVGENIEESIALNPADPVNPVREFKGTQAWEGNVYRYAFLVI